MNSSFSFTRDKTLNSSVNKIVYYDRKEDMAEWQSGNLFPQPIYPMPNYEIWLSSSSTQSWLLKGIRLSNICTYDAALRNGFPNHRVISPPCVGVHTMKDRLVGLVVRRPPRERKVPGSNPACGGIFSESSHTSDLNIGTPVATLPGAWRYRVSTGTGRPGVSILWLGEVECLICNFCLSVAARKTVRADPSLRYTSLLLGRWATNQHKHTTPWR